MVSGERVYRLGWVLAHAHAFGWYDSLFLPFDRPWEAATPCMVLNTRDLDGDEVPEPARRVGMERAIGMAQVQGVVEHARGVVAAPTSDQLLAAFLYYYDHDAFIGEEALRRAGAPEPSEAASR